MIGPFDDFGQQTIRRHARKHQPARFERGAVGGVDFVAVAVAFADRGLAIDRRDMAVAIQPRFIGAQPHRAAQIAAFGAGFQAFGGHPFGDNAHNRLIHRAEFGRASRCDPGGVARAFDAGHLHAEANSEKRHAPLAGKPHRGDLAFSATLAEPAGHQNAVHRFEPRGDFVIALFEQFGIEPADVDFDAVGQASMHQCFVQRFVGIGQPDIFADHADRHFAFGMVEAIDHIFPARQFGFGRGQAEMAQHFVVETLGMVLQRDRIDAAGIERGDHRRFAHVAELRDLGAFAFGQRAFATAQQDIGLNAEPGQFAHRMLGRLGLQFARSRNIRHQRHVDKAALFAFQFVVQLAQRLDKRQAFDIADRTADFAQHEIEIVGFGLGKGLDRVCHMRNHLHGRAEIITAPFAGDDVAIDPARGDVVCLPRRNPGEAFIVAQVEVGFGPVVGHIDFAMLVGAHRARIDVEIGVELADADTKSARLQQCRKACRHKTFAERGDHAAGDENVPRHGRRALPSELATAQAVARDYSRQSTGA